MLVEPSPSLGGQPGTEYNFPRPQRVRQSKVPQRVAVSVQQLFRMLDYHVVAFGGSVTALRDRALITCCYFGLFRSSEIIGVHACARGDVRFVVEDGIERVEMPLRRSKADPFGKGSLAVVGASGGRHCGVRYLHAYLDATAHLPATSALFANAARNSPSSTYFNRLLKTLGGAVGMTVRGLSAHSLRHGMATALIVANGSCRDLVLLAGRWSPRSTAADVYFHARGLRLARTAVLVTRAIGA